MVDLDRSKKDQVLFNQFLRMPYEYFKFVYNMYPKSYSAAPYNLSKIISNYHELLRRKMVMDTHNRKLLYGGMPPDYIDKDHQVYGKKEVLDTLASLESNFTKFAKSSALLYLHSPFESSALAAATRLCKAASKTNISWCMGAYPMVLDMLKDFDGDHKASLDKFQDVDVTCLYMVGKDYPTEFTKAYLKLLLETRKVAGKVTILCSHLTPEEFSERYGKGVSLCPLVFTDDNELTNFKALRKLVEG